jgi:hypothetical protein
MNNGGSDTSIRRRNHKWAMIAHKGGKCVQCSKRVSHGNIESFEFHHKGAIGNGHDKTDRWGGGIRDWAPFTEEWFVWASGVDLMCPECHWKEHRPGGQLSLEEFWEVQARLDEYAQGGKNASAT